MGERKSRRKKRRRKKRSVEEMLDLVDFKLSRLELKQYREAFRLAKKRGLSYVV